MTRVRVPPKACSKVMKLLTDDLRETHPHLRRVSKQGDTTLILVKSVSTDLMKALTEVIGEEPEVKNVDVPRNQPVSREQFAEWKKLWPLMFRQPSWRPTPITDQDRPLLEAGIKFVVGLAKKRTASTSPPCCGACAVVLGTSVVGWACDKPADALSVLDGGPLSHAGLRAVDAVSSAVRRLDMGAEDPLTRRRLKRDKKAFKEFKEGQRKRRKLDDDVLEIVEDVTGVDSVVTEHIAAPLTLDESALDPAQYYCKGMTAFFSSPPCLMCGMAFLHSRIDRVVVVDVSAWPEDGLHRPQEMVECSAFHPKWRLGVDPALNHSFIVYRAYRDETDK